MATNLITGKHRAKIGARQLPSQATADLAKSVDYAKPLNMHELGSGTPAFDEWAAAGLARPDIWTRTAPIGWHGCGNIWFAHIHRS